MEIPGAVCGDGDVTLFGPGTAAVDPKDRGFVGGHPLRHFIEETPHLILKSSVRARADISEEVATETANFGEGTEDGIGFVNLFALGEVVVPGATLNDGAQFPPPAILKDGFDKRGCAIWKPSRVAWSPHPCRGC